MKIYVERLLSNKMQQNSPSENIFWQLQQMCTFILLLKPWYNPSLISSSNFNIPLPHRFMQQLEDALNFSLCGTFLISMATMCFTAFSAVTVQYKKTWRFLSLKITVLWNVRLCRREDVNPQAAYSLRVQNLSFIFWNEWDNYVLLLSTSFRHQISRGKIAFFITGKFPCL